MTTRFRCSCPPPLLPPPPVSVTTLHKIRKKKKLLAPMTRLDSNPCRAVLWSIDQRIPVNHPSNVFVSRSIMGPMSGMPRNTDVPYPRVPHAGNVCISQNEQFSYTVLKSLCLTWPPATQAESFIVHYFASILQVKGSKDESPSALLIAAAQSRSLRSLILLESFIDAAHIKVMASALTIPSLPAEFEALTV